MAKELTPEQLAQKFKLNLDSSTGKQIVEKLNDAVQSFVSQYRKASILRELPGEVLSLSVAEALGFSRKVRKLLTDGRFVK